MSEFAHFEKSPELSVRILSMTLPTDQLQRSKRFGDGQGSDLSSRITFHVEISLLKIPQISNVLTSCSHRCSYSKGS